METVVKMEVKTNENVIGPLKFILPRAREMREGEKYSISGIKGRDSITFYLRKGGKTLSVITIDISKDESPRDKRNYRLQKTEFVFQSGEKIKLKRVGSNIPCCRVYIL